MAGRTSVAQAARRFCLNNQHWLLVEEAKHAEHVVLQVGCSESALDSIGDPKEILELSSTGSNAPAQTPLACITWEGFHRSASDELYHATWSHSTGRLELKLPFAVTCLGINPDLHTQPDRLLHPDEVSVWRQQVHQGTVQDHIDTLTLPTLHHHHHQQNV